MVARGAGAEPARPGEVAHQRADQRALAGLASQHRPEIGWLEGQHLVALGEQGFDLAQRRSGAQGDDQFLRCVIDDP